MKWNEITLILLLAVAVASCGTQEPKHEVKKNAVAASFNSDAFIIPDQGGRKLRGQVLYMPIYSNIPSNYKEPRNLNAFLAIHNTDLKNEIKITKVDFFDTEGKIVKNFIATERTVKPLATIIFTISRDDQSGTGSNFIVEWIAERPVNEPLIESIMTDLSGNLGLSFLSAGRVIRQIQ